MEIEGIIYKITNKLNGKLYIGQTKSHICCLNGKLKPSGAQRRWTGHINDSRRKKPNCPKIASAIKKYGVENFEIEEIERCSLEELDEKEKYYIKKLHSIKRGYNICIGGTINLSKKYREALYKKVAETNKREWADKEKRAKRQASMKKSSSRISEKLKTLWTTDEHREKMMKLAKAKWTKERREKMSSNRVKTDNTLPHGINIYKNKGEHTGYKCEIRINSIRYRKCFTSKAFSVEQNLKKATSWMNKIKAEKL